MWRKIPSFPQYEASVDGHIRNAQTKRILKTQSTHGGYLTLCIAKKTNAVHRLVAMAWIVNELCKPTVNHKNRIRHDNRVSNLEWATYKEQAKCQRPKLGTRHKRQVAMISSSGVTLRTFHGTDEAGKYVSQSKKAFSSISACASGKTKSAYGYRWAYVAFEPLDGEEWTNLETDRGAYRISTMGRICNGVTLLAPNIDNQGYPFVLGRSLHILVARAFIPNPLRLPCVNHKDGVKTNAAVSNLEWISYAGNAQHAVTAGLRSNVTPIVEIDAQGNIVGTPFPSAVSAANAHDIGHTSVLKCCRGLTKTVGSKKLRFRFYKNGILQKLQPVAAAATEKDTQQGRPKAIIASENGQERRFESIAAAAKACRVNNKTIVMHSTGQVQHPTSSTRFRFA